MSISPSLSQCDFWTFVSQAFNGWAVSPVLNVIPSKSALSPWDLNLPVTALSVLLSAEATQCSSLVGRKDLHGGHEQVGVSEVLNTMRTPGVFYFLDPILFFACSSLYNLFIEIEIIF